MFLSSCHIKNLFKKKRSRTMTTKRNLQMADIRAPLLAAPKVPQTMVTVDNLLDFVRHGDVGRLKFALRESQFDIDTQDEDGRTALHHAVLGGEEDVIRQLVQYGAGVTIKDYSSKRDSPVHIAIRQGHVDVLRMLLEAPTFDPIKCGALQDSKMLPRMCIVDDILSTEDKDTTLQKRKSDIDQYLIFVRQNTAHILENNFPPGRDSVRDAVIIHDVNVPRMNELFFRLDPTAMRNLHLIGCNLCWKDPNVFSNMQLESLVLSSNSFTTLPSSIFMLQDLKVLKVDGNYLQDIPEDISKLQNLTTFSCDAQHPGLNTLPPSMAKMPKLEVLSCSRNRIENIEVVGYLKGLTAFHCNRNRIARLPHHLIGLKDLVVLDISHNRLKYIPYTLTELIKRLVRFEYFNVTLRPRSIQKDREMLLSHLELQFFLSQHPSIRTLSDINLGVFGESNSGKISLVEALGSEKGLCKLDQSNHIKQFDYHQFELHTNDQNCYVSSFIAGHDLWDPYFKDIRLDINLLTVDLTTLELQNGSKHLFARHVQRLQMWLQSLFEMCPNVPVLIVGTHAEQVKLSYFDLWHIVESVIEHGKSSHGDFYSDSPLASCILCNHRDKPVRRIIAKSKAGTAGFVDHTFVSHEPFANGHVPVEKPPGKTAIKLPHIVGYYEVDSVKNLPKEAKKTNVSIDQLKAAIVRHVCNPTESGVPPSWLAFVRHIGTIHRTLPELPCMPFEEIVSIARSFDIPTPQVPYMLQYFHERGRLLYFAGDEMLSKLVVVNPKWFVEVLNKVLRNSLCSQYDIVDLLELLHDEGIDRQLLRSGDASVTSASWLLAALQKLDVCFPIIDNHIEKRYLLPGILEIGEPKEDVWSSLPDWGEKQVTYQLKLSRPRPYLFTEFVTMLSSGGSKILEIVPEPSPVFLAHHAVFYSTVDIRGCGDCYRHRLDASEVEVESDVKETDDILHKVHIALDPCFKSVQVSVRGIKPCCIFQKVADYIDLYFGLSGFHRKAREAKGIPDGPVVGFDEHIFDGYCTIDQKLKDTSRSVAESELNHPQWDLLCPKCVLTHTIDPELFPRARMTPKKKAICKRWHNLGSWARALRGDYKVTDTVPRGLLTSIPDNCHPRLALVLPPSYATSRKEWHLYLKTKFLEGYEVHFLCEHTSYWHFTREPGYRLNHTAPFITKAGAQLPGLLEMSLALVQIINSSSELTHNGRLVAPVVADLVKMYEYLGATDVHVGDPLVWLGRNKDRLVGMLTKVISNLNTAIADLFFKTSNSVDADTYLKGSCLLNRHALARYLRINDTSGTFGPLRPVFVGKELRWVCREHFVELQRFN